MYQKLLLMLLPVLLISMIVTGCNSQTSNLAPVEREQIKNVVKEYVTRDTEIPEYDVEIEEVADQWARVSLKPAGVEGEPAIVYLQNQADLVDEAPTAATTVQPGHEARVETSTGWAIVLGPGVNFTADELNEVGVPPEIRQ